MQNINSYIDKHKQRFINELIDLLKIPSISADSAYKEDVLNTADAIKVSLEKAGCDKVEICETDGYPIVYGEKIIDKNLPTVLVYGHYDVQPPDPLDLWNSPPFEPIIQNTEKHPEGAIFARGACDDKGQMYMHVKALEYMTNKRKPCNSLAFYPIALDNESTARTRPTSIIPTNNPSEYDEFCLQKR